VFGVWDADELRDRLRDFAVYELGHRDGVLIVDLSRSRDYPDLCRIVRPLWS
jgi:hypothetical protein